VHEKTVRILLVEDDPADARLVYEAFSEIGPQCCELTVAQTGAQALDMLFQRGKYSDYVLPDLVLLDIRLPILSGHEVLNAIRSNSPVNSLPVLILSTSQNQEDIQRAYALGASCYLVKPRAYEDVVGLCRALLGFWFHKATSLPTVLRAAS
jgi:CheY-like chemotaxis protein